MFSLNNVVGPHKNRISQFLKSKMTESSHLVKNFQKKIKLRIDLKWPEMRVI